MPFLKVTSLTNIINCQSKYEFMNIPPINILF